MSAPAVSRLDDDLYLIDAMLFGIPNRLACYLYDTPERVLIECGPSVTLPFLVKALDSLGIDDLASIVVTHIHLDHAGGAGHLAARYPNARIGVHDLGARHLVEPDRLLHSATRIYGEEGMASLWGPMEPIDRDRIMILEEGSTVALGNGQVLDVMYTPGHAKHHIVFHDARRGGFYVGDSVGLVFPHGHFVQPNTPPPDLDPPVLIEQLHRMAAREPAFLGFAHYGIHDDPARALEEAEERLDDWVVFVEQLGEMDPDAASLALRERTLRRYRKEGIPEAVIEKYDTGTFWPMQAAGIQRWLSQRS